MPGLCIIISSCGLNLQNAGKACNYNILILPIIRVSFVTPPRLAGWSTPVCSYGDCTKTKLDLPLRIGWNEIGLQMLGQVAAWQLQIALWSKLRFGLARATFFTRIYFS
jgi:hypothetical protein